MFYMILNKFFAIVKQIKVSNRCTFKIFVQKGDRNLETLFLFSLHNLFSIIHLLLQ